MKQYYFASVGNRTDAFCVDFDKLTVVSLLIDDVNVFKIYKFNCDTPHETAASLLKDKYIPVTEEKFIDVYNHIIANIL